MAIAEPPVIEISEIARPDPAPRQPKPSEVLRAFPRERWRRGTMRDSLGRMCAIGILADAAGYDWDHRGTTGTVSRLIADHFDLPFFVQELIPAINDRSSSSTAVCSCFLCQGMYGNGRAGLDGVIDFLEEKGY